ncbi:MAG: ABC transporter ATP-binding protein [Acidobacteriota bacterium]
MSNVIEIQNLTKDYELGFVRKRRVRALDDLSLTVHSGQIFGFLGGNGAGKTTTIKLLMRLLFPSSGSARILGLDIADVDMHRQIGYCPENPYFYDYLTARELMNYFGELFGYDRSRQKARTEELLTSVGLEEKSWNKQLRTFSKGMLQRVGLAQALINDPEIVFLDEPMSGLDPIGRREVRQLISGLRDRGTTVFMSTHILSDIESLCDEVAILRGGKLAATGSLDQLLQADDQQRGFEISLAGISEDGLRANLKENAGLEIHAAPKGVIVVTPDESNIDIVLAAARDGGGKLISVQPVKQSLEELFVKENLD